MRSRLVVGLDQALSSAQNFALFIIAARNLDQSDLGKFALIFAIVAVGQLVVESIISEPQLLVSFNARAQVPLWPSLILAALTAGPLSFLALVMYGESACLTVSLSVVTLSLFNTSRYWMIATQRHYSLIFFDTSWIFVWLAAVWAVKPASFVEHLATWSGSAAIPVALLALRLRKRSLCRLRSSMRVLAKYWRSSGRTLLIDNSLNATTDNLLILALGAIMGATSVAPLRGAMQLLGPLSVLATAARLICLPAIVAAGGSQQPESKRLLRIVGFVGTVLVAVVGAVLYLLPTEWGESLLGASWDSAHGVLLPIIASRLFFTLYMPAMLAMRADVRSRPLLQARLLSIVAIFVGACVGAFFAGSGGAAQGIAVGFGASAIVYIAANTSNSTRSARSVR